MSSDRSLFQRFPLLAKHKPRNSSDVDRAAPQKHSLRSGKSCTCALDRAAAQKHSFRSGNSCIRSGVLLRAPFTQVGTGKIRYPLLRAATTKPSSTTSWPLLHHGTMGYRETESSNLAATVASACMMPCVLHELAAGVCHQLELQEALTARCAPYAWLHKPCLAAGGRQPHQPWINLQIDNAARQHER